VEVLHGKGTGALRAAIRNALAGRPDVAGVESAAWNQGGDGVTVVRLS
jgi:DNA mismatch repair protein MutS2